MIEVILFDIDDTLVNHSDAERKAVQDIRRLFFPAIDPNAFETVWLGKTKANWELFRRGEISFADQRIKRIQDVWGSFGRAVKTDEAEENFKQYLALYKANWALFPDVADVLKEFQKRAIRLGVISNGNTDQQTRKLLSTGIFPYFQNDLILISEAVGVSKPDPAIFLQAQNIVGKKHDSMLFIGDDLPIDIKPSLGLGWSAALVDYFDKYSSVPEGCVRIRNLNQIFQTQQFKTP